MLKKEFSSIVSILSMIYIFNGCSGSTGGGNALSSATTALVRAPDVNPSALDSATSSVTSFMAELDQSIYENDYESLLIPGSSLDIEVVSTPITDGVSFVMKQCADDSQSHYVSIAATNSIGLVKYVKTETLASSNLNINSTVYTDSSGAVSDSREVTVRSSQPYDFYSSFSSTGSLNKFAATNGTSHVVGAWNDNQGCAKIGTSGTEVGFILSVGTDGERTCTTSTDTSLCASLPTMETSIPAFSTYSGGQTYDCQMATGCTQVTPASAISLEDDGGTMCAALNGAMEYWNSASTTVDCATTTTAAGVCACLWPFYAAASQKVKASMRSGECKVKGLVNNGEFTLGSDLKTSKTICIDNLSIGG